jgi:hypothetical protein
VAKKYFETISKGSRKVRRPILRWLQDAENDLRQLNMKRWRQKANYREGCASQLLGGQ